jgi:hypothetical protein
VGIPKFSLFLAMSVPSKWRKCQKTGGTKSISEKHNGGEE